MINKLFEDTFKLLRHIFLKNCLLYENILSFIFHMVSLKYKNYEDMRHYFKKKCNNFIFDHLNNIFFNI